MKELKYSVKVESLYIKIYINDILFLMYNQQDFKGMQSWIMGENFYCIEIYLKDTTIELNFDSFQKWKNILKLIEEYN